MPALCDEQCDRNRSERRNYGKLVKNAVKYPAVDFRDATGPKKRRTIKRLFKYFLIARNRFTSAAAAGMLRFHFFRIIPIQCAAEGQGRLTTGERIPHFSLRNTILSVGASDLERMGQVASIRR